MDLGLNGAVVLVVGGSGYIGREVARQFAAEGAQVVVAGRTAASLEAVAAEVGGGASTQVIDTASDASVAQAIAEVVDAHGSLDVVVELAAPPAGTLPQSEASDPAVVLQAIDGKALGYLRVANAALAVMVPRGYGRIVFVNGQNAYVTGSIAASARNGVVMTVAKNLADSVAGSGVTLNTVNPGTVTDEPSGEQQRGLPGQSSAEQVASVVVFLGSRASAGVSGEAVSLGHRMHGIVGG